MDGVPVKMRVARKSRLLRGKHMARTAHSRGSHMPVEAGTRWRSNVTSWTKSILCGISTYKRHFNPETSSS